MRDGSEEVPSPTEGENGQRSSTDHLDGHGDGSPSTTRSSKRRPSRGQTTTEKNVEEGQDANKTPSRVRSSGRQRKPPKRYVEEIDESTPTKRSVSPTERRNTRGASKASDPSEVDESEWEAPEPRAQRPRRTRSKRTSVRFNTKDESTEEERDEENAQSEDQDGFDDLVSMQLHPDLPTQDLEIKDTSMVVEELPEYAEEFQNQVQRGLHDELGTMTKFILEKLNGKRPTPLKGVESEYQKVHHLIEQTVTAGEGNSMLVYGSRGCGKSTIVETVISSLKQEHGDDFHVVRLNGFLHTDDRLALREMWRQLGRETNTEDEAEKVSSYADTMATLLALLSHPEELFGSGSKDTVTAKSIVIILDEFDLFVSHPRQTLLYNLFDIAQARKAPVAVIGLTTKVDVTEILEKRVKSRFSHRYVFVPLPKSLDTFSDICYTGLNVEEGEVSELSALVGGEGAMKSKNWRTLLDGWRAYLKVCQRLSSRYILTTPGPMER